MSNIKITDLPEALSITNDDLLVMVDSGNPYVTKKIAWKNIDAPSGTITYVRKNNQWIDIKQSLSVDNISQMSAEEYYASSGYQSNTLYVLTGEYNDVKIGSPFNQAEYSLFEDNQKVYLSDNIHSDVEFYLTLSAAAKTSLSTIPRNFAYSSTGYGAPTLLEKIDSNGSYVNALNALFGENDSENDAIFNTFITSGIFGNSTVDMHAEPLIIIAPTQYKYSQTWSSADLKFKINKKEFGPYSVQVRGKGYSSFLPYSFKPALKIRASKSISASGRAEIIKQWNGTESFTLNNHLPGYNDGVSCIGEIFQGKFFKKINAACPRTSYSKVFIKDPSKKITTINSNIFTTNVVHYLDNNDSIKLDLNGYTDEKFYVINRTDTTFKLSRSIDGSEAVFTNIANAQIEYFVNFGLYTNLEDLNKIQFDRMFGVNNTRNVYELDPIVSSSDYNSMGRPRELDGNSSLYTLQYSSGVSNLDRSDINNFISKISDTSSTSGTWYNNLLTCVNLQQVLTCFALEAFVGQKDGLSTNINNGYYHFDKNSKLSVIPWNMDSVKFESQFYKDPSSSTSPKSYFFGRLLTNSFTRNAYVETIKNLSGVLLNFYTNKFKDSMTSLISLYDAPTFFIDSKRKLNNLDTDATNLPQGSLNSNLQTLLNKQIYVNNSGYPIEQDIKNFFNQPIPPVMSISRNADELTLTISPVTKTVNNGNCSITNYKLQYTYDNIDGISIQNPATWTNISTTEQANTPRTINLNSNPYNQQPSGVRFRACALPSGLFSEETIFYKYTTTTTTTLAPTTTTAIPTTTTTTTTTTTSPIKY